MSVVLQRSHPAVRATLVGAYVLCVEWARVSIQTQPGLAIAALVIGGVALGAVALGTPADRLGLGTSRIGLRIVGGMALAVINLLMGLPVALAMATIQAVRADSRSAAARAEA